MLTFHLSFIIILLGAGVTRWFGFEGMMMISEGESSNKVYSADPYFWVKINDGKMQTKPFMLKKYMTEVKPFGINVNYFSIPVEFPNHPEGITIEYVDFHKKMIELLEINDSIKGMALEIITDGMKSNYLSKGEFIFAGQTAISFEKKDAMPGVQLYQDGGRIMIRSKNPMSYLPMAQMQKARQSGQEVSDSLFVKVPADSLVQFQTTTLYNIDGQQIVFKQILQHAKMMLLPSGRRDLGADYLTVKVTEGNKSKIVQLKGGMGAIPNHVIFEFNGLTYEMEYGSILFDLPFSIACRDFQLDKYPGSDSPSSFASEVTIIDEKNNYTHDQRIFMNNVMDYQGYRFFQSSYDLDNPATPENEEGTRLSVNADWWGTNITYLGYLLMAIGMILSLFAPVGRFRDLIERLKKLNAKKMQIMKVWLTAFGLGSSFITFSQSNHDPSHTHTPRVEQIFGVMSEEHSDEVATLLVQDFQGRIVPMHTLCLDLMRKIHRKETYEDYNAIQTIVSMHMYPSYWFDKKIVYVSANLRDTLGIKDSYASIKDLLNEHHEFKLFNEHQKAHQKLESKRNEFDKNLIKLVDRFSVIQTFPGWDYLRLIPLKGDPNNTWYNPTDEIVTKTDMKSFETTRDYFVELFIASKSKDYSKANKALEELKKMQRENSGKVAPSETAVKIEVSYNKMQIFKNSYRTYLTIGMVMLILFFISIFSNQNKRTFKVLKIIRKVLIFLVIITFLYHGTGLGIRWYISGHAPWSNGYEALIFMAWVSIVAGFCLNKWNEVILPGALILAGLMIFVTELELLDPEITNLQPVLKSYWLKIHVAVITGSYAFLGLGAIVSFMNLVLYIFRNEKNGKLVTLNINELTNVSEMTITIGLFMLTIGTFLGGVWANESWGRYWGWDPKETWALVSVLVYAVVLHLRYIPALKSKFTFNVVWF